MRVVFLLAGIGKRMGKLTKDRPKCLIVLGGKPLLEHLLEKFIANGIRDYVFILGHKKEKIIKFVKNKFGDTININLVYNDKFKEANNAYSMWCAKDVLAGKEFILCNGDVVISRPIVRKLMGSSKKSAIMLDVSNKTKDIDSPKTIIKDEYIIDIGRHIPIEKNGGYAIGLYKFNKELSTAYFNEIGRMLKANQYNSGFHDPLLTLFSKYGVLYASTDGLSWADLDKPEDIPHVKEVLNRIKIEENN